MYALEYFLAFRLANKLVCPICSNILRVMRAPSTEEEPNGVNRFECRICPYIAPIEEPIFDRQRYKAKEAPEIIVGEYDHPISVEFVHEMI